jgi:hypothetical protein
MRSVTSAISRRARFPCCSALLAPAVGDLDAEAVLAEPQLVAGVLPLTIERSSAEARSASCARPLRDSLLLMPDVIIRPTRASDDSRQECEDLARAMTDRGFEPAIESPSEKGGALGSVDLFVEVTDRASEHALHELVSYFTQHGWKKVREAETQSKQDAAEEKRPHQGARMSSKGSAHRIVMIAVGDTRTVMERSER